MQSNLTKKRKKVAKSKRIEQNKQFLMNLAHIRLTIWLIAREKLAGIWLISDEISVSLENRDKRVEAGGFR